MIQLLDHSSVKAQAIYYLGDIHGNFSLISYYIKHKHLSNCIIVQVGDFGIYSIKKNKYALSDLNDDLIKNNISLYVIRGNHDNPEFFTNEYHYSKIFFIKDYSVIDFIIDDQPLRLLGIGGALSVDRVERKIRDVKERTITWWEDEEVIFYDDEIIDQITGVNVMVTHTAANWVAPLTLSGIVYHFAKNDPTLLNDLKDEREKMTLLWNRIIKNNKETLTDCYYGHFHFSETLYHNDVAYRLLGIGELK